MRKIAIAALLVAAGCATPPRPPPAAPPPLPPLTGQTMRIHVIDVGQGDAVLVEFPCAAMLIDAGGEHNELFDSDRALRDYLDQFFARRPDLARTFALLVITHPHIDHTRGIPALLEHYRFQNVIDSGQDTSSGKPQHIKLHEYVRAHPEVGHRDIRVEDLPARDGLTDGVIDPIKCKDVDPRLRVLWGHLGTDPGWGGKRFGKTPYENLNNHSVVLRIDFGKSAALFTGDLEEQAIGAMLARYRGSPLFDVDFYKVGHHGSWNGTTEDLVAAMTPQVAVISMGRSSRKLPWTAWKYGHPRAKVIDILAAKITRRRPATEVQVASGTEDFAPQKLEIAVYGTAWDGTTVVELDQVGNIAVTTANGSVAAR